MLRENMKSLYVVVLLASVFGFGWACGEVTVGGDPLDNTTITLTNYGGPVADAPIIFHDENGIILEELSTNDQGQVVRASDDAAMISVITASPSDDLLSITTFLDVNEHVELDLRAPGTGSLTDYTVNLVSGFPGADEYIVMTPCGNHSSTTPNDPIMVAAGAHCYDDVGNLNLLALAIDSTDTVRAASYIRGHNPETLTIDLPNWDDSLELLTAQIDSLPAAGSFTITSSVVTNGAAAPLLSPTGGVGAFSIGFPPTFVDQVQASFINTINADNTAGIIRRVSDSLPTTISVQRANLLAPATISSATDSFIEWQTDESIDANIVTRISDGGVTWTFVGAGTRRTASHPVLPSQWASQLTGADWLSDTILLLERSDASGSGAHLQGAQLGGGVDASGTTEVEVRFSTTTDDS